MELITRTSFYCFLARWGNWHLVARLFSPEIWHVLFQLPVEYPMTTKNSTGWIILEEVLQSATSLQPCHQSHYFRFYDPSALASLH